MYRKLKFLLIIMFCISIFSQPKYQVENILLDCIYQNYMRKGVDLEEQVQELEKSLINQKELSSSSGQSYFNYFKKLAETDNFDIHFENDLISEILVLSPKELYSEECLQTISKLDSQIIDNSNWGKLSIAFDSIKKGGVINPAIVVQKIVSIISPEDFEHTYYKTISLIAIAYIGHSNSSQFQEPVSAKNKSIPNLVQLKIEILNGAEIYVDDGRINVDKLGKIVKAFILKNCEKSLILISGKSSYATYIEILQKIKSIYSEIREEKSKEIYKCSFSKLNEVEQNKIKDKYPIIINIPD